MLLTDPAFIKQLESLYLLARKVLGGTLQADRKSTRKGAGITFADYSEYALGDDYRAIDASRSMDAKFFYAQRLLAALAYIALHSMDKVVIYGMAETIKSITRPTLGRGKTLSVLQTLERAELFGNKSDFSVAAQQLCQWHKKRGLVIVVSDFFFPSGFEQGLKYLRWHHHDVFCIQVQDREDRECHFKGDVELRCMESGQSRQLTVTHAEARVYEQAVQDWNNRLQALCATQGLGLVSTLTEVPFERVVQHILRQGGLVS